MSAPPLEFDLSPAPVRRREEESLKVGLDQKLRLSDDSLNTLVKESAFNQFVMIWLVFLSVISGVLMAFTFTMYDDVQTLIDFH